MNVLPWQAVTYYTAGSGYAQLAQRLRESLSRLNLGLYALEVPCQGSWLRNIRYRPAFLLEAAARFPGRDLVWIDADGEVCQYPRLFDELSHCQDFEVAAHLRKGMELLGGTIWLRGASLLTLVREWKERLDRVPMAKEQVILHQLIRDKLDYRFFNLPATYCKIFDLMAAVGPPVILHHQASRKLKAQVGILPEERAHRGQLIELERRARLRRIRVHGAR